MKQKLEGSKKKRFYSEIWKNAVWGGRAGEGCENPVGLSICHGLMVAVSKVASLLRGEVGWNR